MDLAREAQQHLDRLVGESAAFRDGQLDAIRAVVEERSRALVVQRTGWGKSAVYLIATRMLRERGAGPTLLISPLLVLMRNQIAMAERLGVAAETVNSANRDDWDRVFERIDRDEVDLLLISPERLNNQQFRKDVLPDLQRRVGLLVVDEAHCISDWGHDFRPDYRRIGRIIRLLPPGSPVLCTTATANDRVVDDVVEQLGDGLRVIRGPLDRESLILQVLPHASPAERLAWLAEQIPRFDGSGIVYCLTTHDTDRVADFLRLQGIDALAYAGAHDGDYRLEVERRLDARDVKVVVATSALGMGYDNPQLPFVIHYQSPGSAIAYYQQVGRAGRAIDTAYGVMMSGSEAVDIQNWFIETAFPVEAHATAIVDALARSDGLTRRDLLGMVNIRAGRLDAALKILEVDGVVERDGSRWYRTANPWTYDRDHVEAITQRRRREQEMMAEYLTTDACLMQFLRLQLDDPAAQPCGRCANCAGPALPVGASPELVVAALDYLRRIHFDIEPRKQWASGGRIPQELRLEPGIALCRWGDPEWGRLVADGKYGDGAGGFADELVDGTVAMVEEWSPEPAPQWVTCVPSMRHDGLVPDFARRLAERLGIPFLDLVTQTRTHPRQREMENSPQQFRNVNGVFAVDGDVPGTPGLLVDDVVDSRWTITTIGVALREAGSGPVYPVALAIAAGR
jgi:ATP-dependent DNA helicase RecQ